MEVVALDFTAEYMSYNSELQLFRVIKGTALDGKIERSNYNKRRRKLFTYKEKLRECLSQKFAHLSNLFIVDSTPVEICKISRAKRSNICATDKIKPDFGYKLHLVCDENAIVHSFDFMPASMHDVNYLKDVKYNLQNCELIGDRGYISADYQQDLFSYNQIKLSVPMRSNSLNPLQFSPLKRRKRKRIETLISQLDGQFSMNINYAKTFDGLATRIISKIAALTMIQYLNLFVFNRNLNHIKVNIL